MLKDWTLGSILKGFFFLVIVFNSPGCPFSLAVCLRNRGEGEWKGTWEGGSVESSSALAGVPPPATTVGCLQTPVTPETLSSGLLKAQHACVCVLSHMNIYTHTFKKHLKRKLAEGRSVEIKNSESHLLVYIIMERKWSPRIFWKDVKCHAKPSWFSHTPLQRRDGMAGHEEDKRVDLRSGHKEWWEACEEAIRKLSLIALAKEQEGIQGFCPEVHCDTS